MAYSDALGTASLSYDGLNRLTAYTDSNGNNVAYEYDAMGRITKLTPAQGANYRTEYGYNANGSVRQVRVYDAGSSADTTYTYSTTTGRLTERHFPTVSGQYVKTGYSYDAYGRLEYETVTRESGGTTNLFRTQYAYSRIAFGTQLQRTEKVYQLGNWVDADRTTYQWDTLGRQAFEQREDWASPSWASRYDITQVYDKNGNRTGYDKNVTAGYTADYGKSYNLSYNYDAVNNLTGITDSDDANYSCVVVSDANMNITSVEEKAGSRPGAGVLYSYFDYDGLNRLTAFRTKRQLNTPPLPASWTWAKRSHQYDATGRLVKSNYKTWIDGTSEPSGDSLEHVYAGSKHVQNYDGANYGAVWHWAGAQNEHMSPLCSPNADTSSQKGYNIANGGADVAAGAGGPAGGAGGMTPQKRTFLTPTSEGDQRHLFGQGRPMAKDSSGSGSNWANGTASQPTVAGQSAVTSRLFFDGTVTGTDMSRATDAREKDRMGIFGTGLSYAGSYGRVTSESIGRDLNPLGRGAGQALVGGTLSERFGILAKSLPNSVLSNASGNSVNNAGVVDSFHFGRDVNCGCCSFALCMKPVTKDGECECDALLREFYELDCCPHGKLINEKCHSLVCQIINCYSKHSCSNLHDPCPGLGLDEESVQCLLGFCKCSGSSAAGCSSNIKIPEADLSPANSPNWIPPGKGPDTGKTRLCYANFLDTLNSYKYMHGKCKCLITNRRVLQCLEKGMDAFIKNMYRRVRFCHDQNTTFPADKTPSYCLVCSDQRKYQECARTQNGVAYFCCNQMSKANTFCSTVQGIASCSSMHVFLHESVHVGGHVIDPVVGVADCGGAFDDYDGKPGIGNEFWEYASCICTGRFQNEL